MISAVPPTWKAPLSASHMTGFFLSFVVRPKYQFRETLIFNPKTLLLTVVYYSILLVSNMPLT